MKNVSISRKAFSVSTHKTLNAIDINGKDTTREYGRAPCRCKVLKVLPISSTGFANTVLFGTCDEFGRPANVLCADGQERVLTFAFTHDDKIRVKESQIVEQNEVVYMEGKTGNATGNHIHLEVGQGWQYKKIKDKNGNFCLTNLLYAYKVFWLKEGWHKVVNFGLNGYKFSWIDGIDGEVTMNDVIHVIRVKRDPNYDYQISIDGNRFGTAYDSTTSNGFSDKNLEKEGWEEVISTNGSIFYYYDGACYAEGLEKSRGVNNQPFDMQAVSKFKDTMALGGLYNGDLIIDYQKNIQAYIDNYYGAITGAFGLLKNGEKNIAGAELENIRNGLYSGLSGRTVWGYDSKTDTYMVISHPGVTGKSGIRGNALVELCKREGMTDAICLDGGGSRWLRFEGKELATTTRKTKNGVLLYRRKKKGTILDEPINKPVEEVKPIQDASPKEEIKELLAKLIELVEKL